MLWTVVNPCCCCNIDHKLIFLDSKSEAWCDLIGWTNKQLQTATAWGVFLHRLCRAPTHSPSFLSSTLDWFVVHTRILSFTVHRLIVTTQNKMGREQNSSQIPGVSATTISLMPYSMFDFSDCLMKLPICPLNNANLFNWTQPRDGSTSRLWASHCIKLSSGFKDMSIPGQCWSQLLGEVSMAATTLPIMSHHQSCGQNKNGCGKELWHQQNYSQYL